MNVQSFIQNIKESHLLGTSVIIFTADHYPVLFFAAFLEQLRLLHVPAPKRLMFDDALLSDIDAQLMTTFLGQKDLLWCGDISSLETAAHKKRIFSVMQTYAGPHTLLCFMNVSDVPSSLNQASILNIQDINFVEKEALVTLVVPLLQKNQLLDMGIKNSEKLSLDMLVMLAKYRVVLGKNTQFFMESWFDKLVVPQSSMFTLSQYFFSYKIKSFWTMWHHIKDEYPEQFWITFWSEQLWRSYYVISFLKQHSVAQAKQIAFRLPFSFIQKDWQLSSQEDIVRAHQFLADADFKIKNGGSGLFLELFYNKFLLKQF